MPPIFGYICPYNASPEEEAADSTQRARIEAYAKDHNLNLHSLFADAAESSRLPWFERPSGQRLARRLEPGSHVIVPDPLTVCHTKLADLLEIIESFNERGIVLTFIHCKVKENTFCTISTVGDMGETCIRLLRFMVDWKKRDRSDAVSEGMREKRQRGKKHCRHAGYGFRWSHGKRKDDPKEQDMIANIVEWRDKGFSFNEIAAHLLRCGVVAATGREWSPSRVRRAYYSELQRRATVE